MARKEMPIFTKTFELLSWLVPATHHFPKTHRHTVTARFLHVAFEFGELLQEADLRQGSRRLIALRLADEALAKLRYYLRLVVVGSGFLLVNMSMYRRWLLKSAAY